jgi:mRNA interferase RelE/StbE
MADYQLVITDSAKQDIMALDTVVRKRIGKKLLYFTSLPDPLVPAERLISPKLGTYRWRIGDYRIIFDLQGHDAIILRVRHRREVYRDK